MTQAENRQPFSPDPAENYERYFVPTIGRPVAAALVGAAALEEGDRVLDVACGTGIVARLAVSRVGEAGSVDALDPDPAVIAVARDAASPESGITWHVAPAEAIPLTDESVDVVLCSMGLQFFSDRVAGLREMRRVLVPGGRLLATLPGPTPPPLEAMADALAHCVGPDAGGFVHTVFSLHDPGEIRALATDAGFDDVAVRSKDVALRLPPPPDFLWQYVLGTPLARVVAGIDEAGRAALERDFTERCRGMVEDGGLVGTVRMTTLNVAR